MITITINKLNEWWLNELSVRDKVMILGGYDKNDVDNISTESLIIELFGDAKFDLNEEWFRESNEDKLSYYWEFMGEPTTTPFDLLDKDNSDEYVKFLSKRRFVELLGLKVEDWTIYTDEHLFNEWNKLSDIEKRKRLG